MKNKNNIIIILIIAIVLVLNLISQDFFLRLDFTKNKQYTLSRATKDILKNLKEPVTVKAYFNEDLPPDVARGKKEFKELLIEYSNRSKGMLVYEFINPSEKENIEQEAMQAGIQPVMINVREKDQMKQQKAYMGAVISMGEKKEVLPFLQPGSPLEYSLSSAIKKISVENKPTIGLLQGHGEPGIQEMVQVYNELSVLYNIEPLTLTDSTAIPEKFKTIAMIRPTDSIKASHFDQLDKFLARGGRILLALNRVKGDLSTAYGTAVNNGLESWLKTKGIVADDYFVVDARCASVQVQQQQSGFRFISSVQFPYIPVVSNFAKHPITTGLESVIMKFPTTLEFKGDSSVKYTPIAFSSDKSGTEKPPLYFNIQKDWNESDFPQKNLVLAATLEGKFSGSTQTKMVIIANGDFAVNGPQNQAQQIQPDNINLMVNSIDWLSDDTGLIGLRTKSITSHPIKEISDATKTTLKWLNFLLPILLIIAYGLFRTQMNRNTRIKRMEESYV
jgi:gliding-associated putative ABC transporter substrate-binding component GldG